MALEISDLTVSYGVAPAVDGISMTAAPGELTAVLGANGAGKSSLLRAVMGLVRPADGRIALDGDELAHRGVADTARRGVALVPEGRSLFRSLSVQENLRIAGTGTGADSLDDRIAAVYELFPALTERRSTAACMLSGGEQQMVALGRALVADPRVVMLDEPSFGLAPKLVELVWDVLAKLREQGRIIVLVEQNARAALEIADRAYVLHAGRVEASGAASELASLESVQRAYLGG